MPLMPNFVKNKVQGRSVNAKGQVVYKKSNPAGAHREQNPDPDELTSTLAKIVDLSEFVKDKHNEHQAIHNILGAIRVLYNRMRVHNNKRMQEEERNFKKSEICCSNIVTGEFGHI